PHHLAPAPRHEERHVGVVVERVLGGVEEFAALHEERRHPVQVAVVDLPLEADELVLLDAALDARDLDVVVGPGARDGLEGGGLRRHASLSDARRAGLCAPRPRAERVMYCMPIEMIRLRMRLRCVQSFSGSFASFFTSSAEDRKPVAPGRASFTSTRVRGRSYGMMPTSRPQRSNSSSARSICGSVCVDMKTARTVSFSTAGFVKGETKRPASVSFRQNMKFSVWSPTTIGMTG